MQERAYICFSTPKRVLLHVMNNEDTNIENAGKILSELKAIHRHWNTARVLHRTEGGLYIGTTDSNVDSMQVRGATWPMPTPYPYLSDVHVLIFSDSGDSHSEEWSEREKLDVIRAYRMVAESGND